MDEKLPAIPGNRQPHVVVGQTQEPAPQITLDVLLNQAKPFFDKWIESEDGKHRREVESENQRHQREIELEKREIELSGRQTYTVTLVISGICGAFVLLAIVLFLQGRETTATDLIKLIVALGGAFAGGYVVGKRKTA